MELSKLQEDARQKLIIALVGEGKSLEWATAMVDASIEQALKTKEEMYRAELAKVNQSILKKILHFFMEERS